MSPYIFMGAHFTKYIIINRKFIMKKHLIILGTIILSTILFQHCCPNQIGQKNMNEIESNIRRIKPFPRGLIEASITPIEVGKKNDKYFCKATVDTVHNLGGGIRPLAERTNYTFEIENGLAEYFQKMVGTKIKCRVTEVPMGMNSNMTIRKYKIISKSKNE